MPANAAPEPVDVIREVAWSIDGATGDPLGLGSDDALRMWSAEASAAVVTLYRLLLAWADRAHAAGSVERGTLWTALQRFAVAHGLEPLVRPELQAATTRWLDEAMARRG